MKKKAQLDINQDMVSFLGVVIVMILMAPIFANMVSTILTETTEQINGTSVEAGQAMQATKNTFLSLWDITIVLLFLLNTIMLLLTAFLVDSHPAFMILYIIFAFFFVVFIPSLTDAVDKIYDAYSVDVGLYLPFTEYIVNYFEVVILGILFLSGVLMYAKIKHYG